VASDRDYLERTIATVRVHRDADNLWPQWANIFADEIERLWESEAERDRLREDLQRIWTASFNTPESMQAFVRDLGRRRAEQWGLDPSLSRPGASVSSVPLNKRLRAHDPSGCADPARCNRNGWRQCEHCSVTEALLCEAAEVIEALATHAAIEHASRPEDERG
jgi:hypothetical protein